MANTREMQMLQVVNTRRLMAVVVFRLLWRLAMGLQPCNTGWKVSSELACKPTKCQGGDSPANKI